MPRSVGGARAGEAPVRLGGAMSVAAGLPHANAPTSRPERSSFTGRSAVVHRGGGEHPSKAPVERRKAVILYFGQGPHAPSIKPRSAPLVLPSPLRSPAPGPSQSASSNPASAPS